MKPPRQPIPPRRRRALLLLALASLVGVLAYGYVLSAEPAPVEQSELPFTYSITWTLLELQQHISAGDVVAITAYEVDSTGGGWLVAKTGDGQLVPIALSVTTSDALRVLAGLGHERLLTAEAMSAAAAARAGHYAQANSSSAIQMLMSVMFVGTILFVVYMIVRRGARLPGIGPASSASNAGTILPAAAGEPPRRPRMADVAGYEEAKLELSEAIEFLSKPQRFFALGASAPRGIMLSGPPGTGKTMLAKAVANEAGVPFYFTSGSDFMEKYVGVGASRVRELFARARKGGRGVIFIDEIDAVGKARGGANSHEEREQTLNALLVEMDGFKTTDEIVVIAATNRDDILDPALMRPGRFSRRIAVTLPDIAAREAVLRVHAASKPLAADVDLAAIARKTYGFSGADLANLLNEAAIMAARRGGTSITADDIHAGWLKTAVGTSRRRSMEPRERSIIAAHEAGHAVCGRVHGDRLRVEEISVLAHGRALGITVSSQEDNDLPGESDLRARLIALMGGRAAEELLFREVTPGASNDFEQANRLAMQMVTRWGMGVDPEADQAGSTGRGELSFVIESDGHQLPEPIRQAQGRAVAAILDDAYATAKETLIAHMDKLQRVGAYLYEHERIDGDEFARVFDGELAPSAEFVREWRAESSMPRDISEAQQLVPQRLARRIEAPVARPEQAPHTATGRPRQAVSVLPRAGRSGLRRGLGRLYRRAVDWLGEEQPA